MHFWIDRHPRPKPTRTQSAPPRARRALPSLHRVDRAFRIVKQNIMHKFNRFRLWAHRVNLQPRVRTTVKVAAVAAFVSCLAYLKIAHHMKANHSLPPDVQEALDQYKSFPTWMYSDAHNILNLETPLIGEIAPRTVIEQAWRKFNLNWHPDRWVRNGFPNATFAASIYAIGERAHSALDKYYEDPYCVKKPYHSTILTPDTLQRAFRTLLKIARAVLRTLPGKPSRPSSQ
jgi:hypothetical protein